MKKKTLEKHILNQVNKNCDDLEELLNIKTMDENDIKKIERLSKNIKYDLKLFVEDYSFNDKESFNEMLEKTVERFSSLTNSSKELYEEIQIKNSFEDRFFQIISNIIDYYLHNNIIDNYIINENLDDLLDLLNDAKKFNIGSLHKLHYNFFSVINSWNNSRETMKKLNDSGKKFVIYRNDNNIIIIDFPSYKYSIEIYKNNSNGGYLYQYLNIEESESETNTESNKNNCVIS